MEEEKGRQKFTNEGTDIAYDEVVAMEQNFRICYLKDRNDRKLQEMNKEVVLPTR